MKITRVDNDHFDVSPILDQASRKIHNRFNGQYVSPTFVKSWNDCPTRQLVQNVVVQDKPKSIASILGTFVHLMYEKMQSEWVPTTKEEMLEVWDEFAKPHHKVDYDSLSDEDKTSLLEKALWYIEKYLTTPDYLEGTGILFKDVWKQPGVEVQSEFYMRAEGFEIFSQLLPVLTNLLDRLDFRDGEIYVLDYKTGESNTGDHKLQMMIYSWGVQLLYGKKPRCFIIAPGAPLQVEEVKWTKRDESLAVENIFKTNNEVKESIKSQIFPRRENKWCEYCPIAKDCLPGNPEAEFEVSEKKLNQ